MKTRINYFFRASVLVSVIFILTLQSFSQGTDSRRITTGNIGIMYLGLSIDPISSKITNEGFSNNLKIKNGSSVNITADAGYFFSDYIGISLGAGYHSYSSILTLGSSSYLFTTTDSEDEEYEMRITGNSIKEHQKISQLGLPVSLIFRYPASEKIGLFVKPGLSFNLPLSTKYDGNGVFSYDAYYPEYPVLLHDLPDFGFPRNYDTKISDELMVKSLNVALTVSGGITYLINDKITILTGATLNRSLGNVSGYEKDSEFRLTTAMDVLYSMMAGSTSSCLHAFGMSIGIRYLLK